MLSWVVNYILQDAVNQNIYAKVKKLGSIFNFFLKSWASKVSDLQCCSHWLTMIPIQNSFLSCKNNTSNVATTSILQTKTP